MKPERVEELLKQYGNALPENSLFTEQEDRRIRLELQAAAREEEELRSSSTVIRRFRQREKAHRTAIAVLAGIAAVLFLMLLGPRIGDGDPAETKRRDIDAYLAAGVQQAAQGDYAAAEASMRKSLDLLLETAPIDTVEHAAILQQIGDVTRAQGRLYQAELLYRDALALRLKHFPEAYASVAEMLTYLGDQAAKQGDLESARESFEEISKLFGFRHRSNTNRAFFEEICALSNERQVDLARRLSDRMPSAEHYRRYVRVQEAAPTKTPLYFKNQARAYLSLAELAMTADEIVTADDYFQKALDAQESLVEIDPDNGEYVRDLSEMLRPMAELARQQSDLVRCRGLLDRSLNLKLLMLEGNSGDAELERSLGDVHGERGQLALQTGDLEAARENFTSYAEIATSLAERYPGTLQHLEDAALAHAQLARVAEFGSDSATAIVHHREVAAASARLAEYQPANPRHLENVAATHIKVGELLTARGDDGGAIDEFEKYVAVYEKLSANEPRNLRYLEDLSLGYGQLAELYSGASNSKLAARYAAQAVITYELLVREDPENTIYRDMLLRSVERAGSASLEQGKSDAAAGYFARLADLRQEVLGSHDPLTARARALQATTIVKQPQSTRAQLVEAEKILRDAGTTLRRAGHKDWEREALETLRDLYEVDRLDYPRKLAEIKNRLK